MNRSTETTAPDHSARIARAAWLCAFVVPLLLATLLLGVKSAQAAPSPPPLVPLVVFDEEEELEEEDEGEFAAVECEIAAEELAAGEIDAAEADAVCAEAMAEEAGEQAGRGASATPRCPIHSVRAHAVERNGRLKITIGYTTNDPTNATIQIRRLGTFKRHLGRSGVLRFSKKLGKRQPRRIVVRITAPSCAKAQASSAKVR